MLKALATALMVASVLAAHAQTKPSAETLMKSALAKAKAEKKNVFVMFDASW